MDPPAARGAARRRRERLWSDHQQKEERRRNLVVEHEAQQRLHSAEVDLWYPVRLDSRSSRTDVFGGTGNGWAGLPATDLENNTVYKDHVNASDDEEKGRA